MSEPWRHKAACNGQPTNWWFPDATGPANPNTQRALALCAGCDVQVQCLAHAQDKPEMHGIWGGLTPRQRLGLRTRLPQITHGTESGYQRHLYYGQNPCPDCRAAHTAIQRAKRQRLKESS